MLELCEALAELAATPEGRLQALAVGFVVGFGRGEPRFGLEDSAPSVSNSRSIAASFFSNGLRALAERWRSRASLRRSSLRLIAAGSCVPPERPRAWYSFAHCL